VGEIIFLYGEMGVGKTTFCKIFDKSISNKKKFTD
jgi:tRNA A37 threonylcarbamoyladenosine biosynthesis protein TsaE